jgi:hypothetical protein
MMARLDQSEKTSAADSDGNGCFIAIALYGDTFTYGSGQRVGADVFLVPRFAWFYIIRSFSLEGEGGNDRDPKRIF